MHLLAAKPGGFVDDEGIIDLAQTPGDIVILAAADSLLSALAQGVTSLLLDPDAYANRQHTPLPSIRLANWMQLLKPAAFDLYEDKVLEHAQVVVVSFFRWSALLAVWIRSTYCLVKSEARQATYFSAG